MLKSTDVVNEFRLAESRIQLHIRQTILEHSCYLSQVGEDLGLDDNLKVQQVTRMVICVRRNRNEHEN